MATVIPSLKLTLFDNGLDFIREGIEAIYGKPGASAIARKYSLLHIYSGILLVLKERLSREHPSLIYKKVEEFGKPNAKTVDFDEVVNRLIQVARVKLDQDDLSLLRKAQSERNKIEHFEVTFEIQGFDNLVGKLIEFLDRFLHGELSTSLAKHLSGSAWQEVSDLAQIAARLRAQRIKKWKRRAAKYKKFSDVELAALLGNQTYHPRNNPDGGEIFLCDECSRDSVVVVEDDIALCTNPDCRSIQMLEKCTVCGEMLNPESGSICSSCQFSIDDG